MSYELKPCPFCGKQAAETLKLITGNEFMDEDDEEFIHSDSFAVICDASKPRGPDGCGAMGGFHPTEAGAIAAWNARAPVVAQSATTDVAALLAELDDARRDAERYRYLRNRVPADVIQNIGEYAGCWIDCEVGETLTLLTGDDADEDIDAAMKGKP